MDITLTAAETAKWNTDADWKAGFLLGLQWGFEGRVDISLVRIKDDGGLTLATYAKRWQSI